MSAGVVILMLGLNAVVGFIPYGWAFMNSFFMNDMPDSSDLVRFVLAGSAACLVSAAIIATLLISGGRMAPTSAMRTALVGSLMAHVAFLLVVVPLILL